MNDLISRQAAVKALEETKQSDPFDRYEYQNIGIDWSIDAIKVLPSVDAVPVRCSECIFWDRCHISHEGLAKCLTGESGIRYRNRSDYCSRGRTKGR